MAPEVIDGKFGFAKYTNAADIYSFGLILYELATRRVPFEDYTPNWKIAEAVLSGERPVVENGECPFDELVLLANL